MLEGSAPKHSDNAVTASAETMDADIGYVTWANEFIDSVLNEVRIGKRRANGMAGAVLEGATENLITRSEDFDLTWVVDPIASVTVLADQAAAPDGSDTGDKITDNAGGANDSLRIGVWVALTANKPHTFSIFVKAGTSPGVTLDINDATAPQIKARSHFVCVGEVWSLDSTDAGLAGVESVGPNGWYRLWVAVGSGSIINGNTHRVVFYPTKRGTTPPSAQYVYAWGAQFEENKGATNPANPSGYVPTAGAAVTHNTDQLRYPATDIGAGDFTLYGAMEAGEGQANLLYITCLNRVPGSTVLAISISGGTVQLFSQAAKTVSVAVDSGMNTVAGRRYVWAMRITRGTKTCEIDIRDVDGGTSANASGVANGVPPLTGLAIAATIGGTLGHDGVYKHVLAYDSVHSDANVAKTLDWLEEQVA